MGAKAWQDWRVGIAVSVGATALLVALLAPFESDVALLNEGLILLLVTLGVSAVWGVRSGIAAAFITNVALNFFFVPPVHRLSVHDAENVFALAAFLIVSVVAGSLVSAARSSANRARRQQAETEALLRLTRALIGQTEAAAALSALCREVVETLGSRGAAVLSIVEGVWRPVAHAGDASAAREPDKEERSVSSRVLETGTPEGLGSSGLGRRQRQPRIIWPSWRDAGNERQLSVTFIPVRLGERSVGILRLDGPFEETVFRTEPERLLGAFAQEAALGLQRLELARAAATADVLRAADEMKGALMASISHDLKTPLASIKASVSALLDADVTWSADDEHAFLATIESQADYLDRVIGQILDLNRIASGALTTQRRLTRVSSILSEVAEVSASLAHRHALKLPPDCGLTVETDQALIRQAMVNLIENAAKYSPDNSTIEIDIADLGDEVEIGVIDQGPGIAPEDLPRVFEAFYRGTRSQRLRAGSGLGLAIVKAFVEAAGGRVRAESYRGGTRAVIVLPQTRVTAAGRT